MGSFNRELDMGPIELHTDNFGRISYARQIKSLFPYPVPHHAKAYPLMLRQRISFFACPKKKRSRGFSYLSEHEIHLPFPIAEPTLNTK